ncbi:MAG: type II toxin-antitoxin system VapC family toxin [Vulcanimicrobiota bacterium]
MVLDTHVWLWWISDPSLLSLTAQESIDLAISQGQKLHLSTISTWEVALLVNKGRLRLTLSARNWVSKTEALSLFEFIPVTNSIALRSVQLKMHPDPADRLIVATALELGLPLVTKDDKLRQLGIDTVW